MEDAIVVKNLTKSYGDLKVLQGVSFSVKKGSMLALLGPNGAGKTTTVRILSTLLKPDGGEVKIQGLDVVKDAKKVRGVIGLTGQYAAIDEQLSGEENLIMMGELYHLGKERATQRAQELLKQFDLVDAAKRKAKTYSGGMKRRLDLGLSLVATPPVIFLDEPTTGLDPRSRIAMWNVIKDLMKQGVTILLTTQYLEEADTLADQVIVIDHGKVITQGTADELKKQVGVDLLELTIGDKVETHTLEHGVADVRAILERYEREGRKINAIDVRKPTLDDVFLHYTGHKNEAVDAESEQN
ncbi:MAG TPA: ATP-binding cassette domain-containing protein [Candidatus Paceibacterota bacterium]